MSFTLITSSSSKSHNQLWITAFRSHVRAHKTTTMYFSQSKKANKLYSRIINREKSRSSLIDVAESRKAD